MPESYHTMKMLNKRPEHENMETKFREKLEHGEHDRDPAIKREHDKAENMRHSSAAHSHDPYHEHHKKNK